LDGNACPETDINAFREQALWGERGKNFGVAACSNHIEGMYGRLNARVGNLKNFRVRFAKITSSITASAGKWSRKVKRGWNSTMKKLQASALAHHWNERDCPVNGHCEHVLGREVPCVHTISQGEWPEEPPPPQFILSTTGPAEIAFTVFEGDWTLAPLGGRPRLSPVENGIEDTLFMAERSPYVRTVLRIRRAIMSLNFGVHFRHSQNEMLFRLGRIQGQLEATLSTSLTDKEIKLRANSMFLLECVQEVTTKEQSGRH
jgi:hypothetical protein